MDPAGLAGIGLALAAILVSMVLEGSSPTSILLIPPMILVFAGTFGAAIASGVLRDAKNFVPSVKRVLTSKLPADDGGLVRTLVEMAERARREGLLALEEMAQSVDDPFLRRGLELAVDGTDPEEVGDILDAEIGAKRGADKAAAKVFTTMGGYAPTIGIIGTVIGLVHVLENLSNPEQLGHLIAGAFVATLWGVLTANVLWLPMGARLARISELEIRRMEVVVEGILAIQAGANPRVIEAKLTSLLPGASRSDEKAA